MMKEITFGYQITIIKLDNIDVVYHGNSLIYHCKYDDYIIE